MTQLILNIENVKILGATKRKSGLDEALEDIEAGRIYHAESTDAMFKQILGK